jgi:hypothetical protein
MCRHLLLLIFVPALFAGCGAATNSADDFSGEEEKVAQVVEDLQDAAQDDAPRRVCQSLLASEVIQKIPGGDCQKAVAKAFDDADNFDLTVDDVRISGTRATARVKAGRDEDQVETITLVREGTVWKISQLAGS